MRTTRINRIFYLLPVFLLAAILGFPGSRSHGGARGPASTFNSDFSYSADSTFYTLSPHVQTSGPILTGSNTGEYVSDVFHQIIRSTDQELRQSAFAEITSDRSFYWAAMVGALTVPYLESGLQHFRLLNPLGTRCSTGMNSGESLWNALSRKSSSTRFSILSTFNQSMRDGSAPPLIDCDQMNPRASAIQLVGSADRRSNGMMQFDIGSHAYDYYLPRKFLNVDATIEAGIRYYLTGDHESQGMLRIYREGLQGYYPCLHNDAPIDYAALIRGAWSVYNGGWGAGACRFARGTQGDVAFNADLQKILNGTSIYARYLTGGDAAALQEIVSNFLNHTDSTLYVSDLLQQDSGSPATQTEPDNTSPPEAPSAPVRKGLIITESAKVRTSPSAMDDSNLCGKVFQGTDLTILSESDGWSKVRFSPSNEQILKDCGPAKFVFDGAIGMQRAEESHAQGRVVNAYFLNVRRDPPWGTVIDVLRDGEKVEILKSWKPDGYQGYPWYQILPSRGWVYGAYLQVSGEVSQ